MAFDSMTAFEKKIESSSEFDEINIDNMLYSETAVVRMSYKVQ